LSGELAGEAEWARPAPAPEPPPNPSSQRERGDPAVPPLPKETPRPKRYSLDTNAIIALERWRIYKDNIRRGKSLSAKLEGAVVMYSITAKQEFLVGASLHDLETLVNVYGMIETPSPPQYMIDILTDRIAKSGAKLDKATLNDIIILSSAWKANSKLLTDEKKLLAIFPRLAENW
jgi:hypothetical protein